MDSQQPSILVTGATGYIGGTVVNQLLSSQNPALVNSCLTLLLRGNSRADDYRKAWGDRSNPFVYEGLDDIETTTNIAAEHDIVLNMTLGFHAASAQALLRGLAQRKVKTGRPVYMVQLSGASNLGDQPVTGAYVEDQEFDDARDDIYASERIREALRPYLQRTTELGVIDEGLRLGVKTLVIMPPLVFGVGTGLHNRISVQIPVYVEAALQYGKGVVVGEGKGELDHVHVRDLASLYEIVVVDIIKTHGANLPQGKKGIMFASNGRHNWEEVGRRVGQECFIEGVIPDYHLQNLTSEEGAKAFKAYADLVGGDLAEIELGLCCNSRTVASVARGLGWEPTRGRHEWMRGFRDDVIAVLERKEEPPWGPIYNMSYTAR